jgi:hypothetical protein
MGRFDAAVTWPRIRSKSSLSGGTKPTSAHNILQVAFRRGVFLWQSLEAVQQTHKYRQPMRETIFVSKAYNFCRTTFTNGTLQPEPLNNRSAQPSKLVNKAWNKTHL